MAYLDSGSTQPLNEAGHTAWESALRDGWADPSSRYYEGRKAAALRDDAIERIAQAIGIRRDEVSITTSGSAANTAAVTAVSRARRRHGGAIGRSAVEHRSVMRATASLVASASDHAGRESSRVEPAPQSYEVQIGVDHFGVLDPDQLTKFLSTGDAQLLAVQWINQETGTCQDIASVAAACQRAEVPLIVDAAQGVGRMPVPQGWDVLTASAHKWGGPSGIGIVAVRSGTPWRPDQSAAPAFPNIPALVAAAAALEESVSTARQHGARLRELTTMIRDRVSKIDGVEVAGHPDQRADHLVTFSTLYLAGDAITDALAERGFAVASGSACADDRGQPSHVLAAMGVLTQGNVRIGLTAATTQQDIEAFLAALVDVIDHLRQDAGVADL